MMKLLKKELRLAASPVTYLFIFFGMTALIPGYPILIGSFFLGLGLFQSFQTAREANDLTYTALLPVAKTDAVRAKYLFCGFIQLCYLLLTSAVTLIRMTALSGAKVYINNPMMNANLVYLGFVMLSLGLFQSVFVGGFFKTGYSLARPFLRFIILSFLTVGLGETLFHLPGMSALNSPGFSNIGLQLAALLLGAISYFALTAVSVQRSLRSFERIDL